MRARSRSDPGRDAGPGPGGDAPTETPFDDVVVDVIGEGDRYAYTYEMDTVELP